MRLKQPDIEVFIASSNSDNPVNTGYNLHFENSGIFCETVIKTNDRLKVTNALLTEKWKDGPAAKKGMISYLGYPLIIPNGKPFGTICVEDNRERIYSETYVKLLENFRDIVQSELDLIYMNEILGRENKTLTDYIDEIQTLRGLIPLCSKCKSIKNSEGYWERVEEYLEKNSDLRIEHELCDDCTKEFNQVEDFIRKHEISTRDRERNNIIVTEVDDFDDEDQKLTIGIYTDTVKKVLQIEPDSIKDAPKIGIPIDTEFIHGLGKVDDRFIIQTEMEDAL